MVLEMGVCPDWIFIGSSKKIIHINLMNGKLPMENVYRQLQANGTYLPDQAATCLVLLIHKLHISNEKTSPRNVKFFLKMDFDVRFTRPRPLSIINCQLYFLFHSCIYLRSKFCSHKRRLCTCFRFLSST